MQSKLPQRWLVLTGVLLGLGLLFVVQWQLWPRPTLAPDPVWPIQVAPTVSAIEQREWRQRAWGRIQSRLDEADQASQRSVQESLDRVASFFASKQGGARPFAKAALSLRGKWALVYDYIPFTAGGGHARYLEEQFALHVLTPQDLQACLEGCVTGYLSRLQGIENQMLVQVRADLSEGELMAAALPLARDGRLLRSEFDRRMKEVTQVVSQDTRLSVGQNGLSLVGGEVAVHLVFRVGAAVSQRLGLSAGMLGAAASSSWATLGLSVVAAIALDYVFDTALWAAGYDPESVVAEKIGAGLANMEQMLVFGLPDARDAYEKLRHLAASDPDPEVRQACQSNADRIARGGQLGLRFELEQLHQQRAKLRREALRRVVVGENP